MSSAALPCWAQRGCDDEMQSRCPHNVPGEPCPADCHFAACSRPTHAVCEDVVKILNPTLDYDASVKEVCRICDFFLSNGPDVEMRDGSVVRQGNPNRFLL